MLEHIYNEACSNINCPNIAANIKDKLQQEAQSKETGFQVGNSNCVWKVELRVRLIPKDLAELYENDRATLHFYLSQVKDDYLQANLPSVDQDVAIQLCCLSIRHYYKDASKSSSDHKKHLETLEKEKGFSNFIPKTVLDAVKHKTLKKLVQTMYKKVYSYTDLEYILKFFELMSTQFAYDHEKFVVTLGWNIAIDLIIGPNLGISYLTHAQAKPTKVTDFESIRLIKTSILSNQANTKVLPSSQSKDSVTSCMVCTCADIKSQLRIQVDGNSEDLAITCTGVNTASSIADLVDGYCIFSGNASSLWDRSVTPASSNSNSLEKSDKRVQLRLGNGDSNGDSACGSLRIPTLNEDYAELRTLTEPDEEGDYSTPTARNYELKRSQIVLSEIIGLGQFGDVHIGTCKMRNSVKNSGNDEGIEDAVHVAIKTCKADADAKTTEKFLEEAC